MTRLWAWWVDRCAREDDARPLALVRIGASMAIVLDLLRVAQLGLVDVLFRPYADGGLSQVQDPAYLVGGWLAPEQAGPVLFWLTLGCMSLVALGVFTRPATLLGVLAYAQLGHLYPPGDRAIDRVLRTVLLILMFSDTHRRLALLGGPALARIKAWPADLLRSFLVIVYLSAGLGKLMQQPAWLGVSGVPVLYRVMSDPLSAHVDANAALPYWWIFRVLGWGTVAMELSSPLLFTRFAPYWAIPGLLMHLGIFSTMELGMFSWGMLSMYPLLLAPWWLPAWDRWRARSA